MNKKKLTQDFCMLRQHCILLRQNYNIYERVLGATAEEEIKRFIANIQDYCDRVGEAVGVGPLDFTCSCCAGDVQAFLGVLRKSRQM